MSPPQTPLSIAQCASIACLLEATAAKPGNVHRGADFDDLTYLDFALSAQAVAPAFAAAEEGARLGETVLAAVRATRAVVATNSNLGAILLLAPLAMVPRNEDLAAGATRVLRNLTPDDCRDVYEAIRLTQPGGVGRVEKADINEEPPADLIAAMSLASDHDLVARQYTNNFQQVLNEVAPWLSEGIDRGWALNDAIIHAHLRLMAAYPDSLIARKSGEAAARQSADRAATVLAAGSPGEHAFQNELESLDFWLRADGRRRNPGTSADLIAAALFVCLRSGAIKTPLRFYN